MCAYVIRIILKSMDDFDRWNKIKKKLCASNIVQKPFPNEGEIWMCILGKNIGFEENGSGGSFLRPVILIKKFNNQMLWVVPLSTKRKVLDFYFNFTDPYNRRVSAIIAQLRLISTKRLTRKMYRLSTKELQEIKNRLKNYL